MEWSVFDDLRGGGDKRGGEEAREREMLIYNLSFFNSFFLSLFSLFSFFLLSPFSPSLLGIINIKYPFKLRLLSCRTAVSINEQTLV